MAFRVTVDHDLCIGDSICESIIPKVFEIRDDGLSYVLVDPVDDADRAECEEAVESCPTDAIAIHDVDAEIDEHLLKSIDAK